jgi:hypothetical protein
LSVRSCLFLMQTISCFSTMLCDCPSRSICREIRMWKTNSYNSSYQNTHACFFTEKLDTTSTCLMRESRNLVELDCRFITTSFPGGSEASDVWWCCLVAFTNVCTNEPVSLFFSADWNIFELWFSKDKTLGEAIQCFKTCTMGPCLVLKRPSSSMGHTCAWSMLTNTLCTDHQRVNL